MLFAGGTSERIVSSAFLDQEEGFPADGLQESIHRLQKFAIEQELRGPPGPHEIVPRTVRFQWRTSEQGDTFPDRIPFIREVVFGALGLALQDLVCAQRPEVLRCHHGIGGGLRAGPQERGGFERPSAGQGFRSVPLGAHRQADGHYPPLQPLCYRRRHKDLSPAVQGGPAGREDGPGRAGDLEWSPSTSLTPS
ncbi:hypothetical protein SRHO_G00186670 [Serrasalmus rhombeus]